MKILSITLRILTVLSIGGGIALWWITRDNLKEKLGGDPNEKLGPTVDAFFDETNTIYDILQAEDDLKESWDTLSNDREYFNVAISYADTLRLPSPEQHPFKILNDTNLKKEAMEKLALRYPDPEKDQDENGVPDIVEQLPGTIRSLNGLDIYRKSPMKHSELPEPEANEGRSGNLLTVSETDSRLDAHSDKLLNTNWKTKVYDPAVENIKKDEVHTKPEDMKKSGFIEKLKTALPKLYFERKELYDRISELRDQAVARDRDLQHKQIQFIATLQEKENFDTQSQHYQLNLQDTQRDFELAKKDWGEQKDALDQKIQTTEDNLRASETAKKEADEEWRTKMEDTRTDYENQLKEKERDAIAREQKSYERGRAEVQEEVGQTLAGGEKPKNFFENTGPAPAPLPQTTPPLTSTQPNANGGNVATGLPDRTASGIVTSVTRISAKDGIIILPIGSNHGVTLGSTFTLIHEGKQAARIKIPQATPTYCIANILPKFGDPHRLRPHDQIQVVQ